MTEIAAREAFQRWPPSEMLWKHVLTLGTGVSGGYLMMPL